ncbi:hypothetical protein FQR65_LT19357 [Abscondita terminalis]|nr:hypothetical protein FQR65_LT19357 [Abscondita terminalis]
MVAAKNGPIEFFETPITYVNGITLEKGKKGNNFMLSYDNMLSNGLMPNSDLRKNTFTTKINYDFTPKLHATVYSTLVVQNTKGRNDANYSGNLVGAFRQCLIGKVSYDNASTYFQNRLAPGSVPKAFGASQKLVSSGYSRENLTTTETNFDLILNYKLILQIIINVTDTPEEMLEELSSSIYASTEVDWKRRAIRFGKFKLPIIPP